ILTGGLAGWRAGGETLAAVILLSASPPARLPAQVALHATIGARYTSALVHDSIVVPVDVQPTIGPALALAISQRTSSPWTPDANLDVSWSSLQRHESGTTSKFNSVTTIAFTVGVRREIRHGLTARAGFGGIKHLPSEEIGMFRAGTGLWAIGTASLYWTPSAGGGERHTTSACPCAMTCTGSLRRHCTPTASPRRSWYIACRWGSARAFWGKAHPRHETATAHWRRARRRLQ
ncbi:MAG TPA: hypothetical protein VGU74_04235, partial [Gemmatimonadales bacterium]|nr:hypothetical protein [Gemmatimonadales bacterium]